MLQTIRFSSYLEALALEIKKTRSAEKSTLRLMAAGARLLEQIGYRDLSIDQICLEARLAKGTFYIYFESKDIFLNQLISRYFAFEQNTYPQFSINQSGFQSALSWVGWYERTFATNVGVLRAVVELGATSDAHLRLWHQRNKVLVDRIVEQVERRLDAALPPESKHLLILSIRSVGGMMDQSLFERYRIGVSVGRDENDPDLMIELHALLIYRAIYGKNPDVSELHLTRAFCLT